MNDDNDYITTISGQRALRSKTLGVACTPEKDGGEVLITFGAFLMMVLLFGSILAPRFFH